MNLLLDIGNSQTKIGVTDGGELIASFKSEHLTEQFVNEILSRYAKISSAIVSSVKEHDPLLEKQLRERLPQVLHFTHLTPVPIQNLYRTPHTLGIDRLAAAVGAYTIFPNENVLIIDLGSAITIDFLNHKGAFLGGSISPGVSLRFKALHEFTDKLPLCSLTERQVELLGEDTRSAIESGVINGIVFEIEAYINRLTALEKELKVIFTGGDGKYFAGKLKNTIFVKDELIFKGLNRVLEYNYNAEKNR